MVSGKPMSMDPISIRTACNGSIHVRGIPPVDDRQKCDGSLTPSRLLGGGMPTSTNRTKWPVQGGAISLQPGWFQGHKTAFIYFNLGLGTVPPNMSHVMLPPFQMVGPTNNPYPGTFCFPQVPLPANISVNVGDNATIQVVLAAQHGAALYNVRLSVLQLGRQAASDLDILQCVDITFAQPEDCVEVTPDNCFNSSDISFAQVFTTGGSLAPSLRSSILTGFTFLPLIISGLLGFLI